MVTKGRQASVNSSLWCKEEYGENLIVQTNEISMDICTNSATSKLSYRQKMLVLNANSPSMFTHSYTNCALRK